MLFLEGILYLGYLGQSSTVNNCVMFSNFIKKTLRFLQNSLTMLFKKKKIKCLPSPVGNDLDDFVFQKSGIF